MMQEAGEQELTTLGNSDHSDIVVIPSELAPFATTMILNEMNGVYTALATVNVCD